ncbi:MAG: HK97-gp10 family putative phage morphogenesis protein [Elusimicrobiales bacterium]
MRIEAAFANAGEVCAALSAASGAAKAGVAAMLEEEGLAAAERLRQTLSVSARDNGPSRPGGAPRSVNGALAASVSHAVETEEGQVSLSIGAGAPYAPYLEHGTGRMAARPFLLPAFEQLNEAVERRLQTLFAEAGL